MNQFIPKKLALEETLGEKLRQARHYQNLKIENIAKKLNIRTEYLIALEEERFENLPSGLYGKNFLKEYASFLKLNPNEFTEYWEKQPTNDKENPFSQKIVKKTKFIIFPKIIRNVILFGAVLICFLYLLFYFKNIVSPPLLIIESPEKNILTSENSIVIIGKTEPEAEIKINGIAVLNNNNGQFSQEINLRKGINNITITAKKKYSREKIITRQILLK
ncbi:MAG: helix-turn-helix domain-containing protein [Patescibacteria group bacterium]|jgi:cytoskeletal protein RodZ